MPKRTTCRYCGVEYSKEFLAERERRRSESIKAALRNAKAKGVKLGRPRTTYVDHITELRRAGWSIAEICKAVGVGRGVVQYVIKTNQVVKGERLRS